MTKNEFKITITEDQNNKRIDIALSHLTTFSRSMIQKLIYQNNISMENDFIKKPNHIVAYNQIYTIIPPKNNIIEKITPEKYELDILYEDDYLIVLNKPAELIVHPGIGNPSNTLINKLLYHCKLSNIDETRLGTVHRLDKGVSGCIIFAKDNNTHVFLNEQFAKRRVNKQYIAICHGILHPIEQYLENYITRDNVYRKKMQIHISKGKIAQMNIRLLKTKNNISMIECNPITGRTHQIRIQLANIKLPILGDKLYGFQQETSRIQELFKNRIALHSNSIECKHPNGKILKITSTLPKEFEL